MPPLPEETATVRCPYCLEPVELYIEMDCEGRWVQDCEVCCHPWQVEAHRDADGALHVRIDPAQ